MKRRDALGLVAGAAALAALPARARAARPPNIVLIVADDLGWGDLGCYGSRHIRTPNIDRLARQGVRMTDFYASANVCTPSRAGLFTGRYPIRTGLAHEVIQAADTNGLPLSEITIAEALRGTHASMLAGKWHLGHVAPYWPPTVHGFGTFAGLKYSNDMRPLGFFRSGAGGALSEEPAVQEKLTDQFFDAGIAFVRENRDRPFFLAVTPSAPHIPLKPGPAFQGRSQWGAYADVVEELDAAVGRLVAAIDGAGLGRDTLIMFTSDNGPWFEGSAGPARGRKGDAGYEGGYLVPMIARWTGTLRPRVSDAIAMNIDLLPTICAATGAPLPAAELDGRDLMPVLRGGGPGPHEQLLLFHNERVAAVRTARWKYVGRAYYRHYHLPIAALGLPLLFDVVADPDETLDQSVRHPDALRDMAARFTAARNRFEPLGIRQQPDVLPTTRRDQP